MMRKLEHTFCVDRLALEDGPQIGSPHFEKYTVRFIFSERAVWGVGGGGMLPDFFFCSLFPVQQTTSGIGHRVK